jgi:hypothetical protein
VQLHKRHKRGMHACVCVQAQDVDEMLDAHVAYLAGIRSRALLDKDSQAFRDTLDHIFDCSKQLVHPLLDCEAHVAACAATQMQVRSH